ncbi:MAG: hypothetical protein NXI24_03225 [bacterium]|nr:hypothetical protein [bacterium]
MNTRLSHIIITLSIATLGALPACSGGDDEGLLLFPPMFGENGAIIDGTGGEAAPEETSSVEIDGLQVVLPNSVNASETPEGDFNGLTYQAAEPNMEVAGFFSQVGSTAGNASDLAGEVIAALNNESQLQTVNLISSQAANGGLFETQIVQIATTTATATNVTGLSNILIGAIGTVNGGAVTALPTSASGETTTNDFRVTLQISHDSAANSNIVGVGVSTADGYAAAEAALTSLLDGSNTAPSGYMQMTGVSSFSGAAPAKADFLWVVDNSGSMGQEQDAVAANAANFFDRMTQTGLDFRIGVITTDSASLKGGDFTDDKTTFQSNVTGLGGSGTESGIYFAEQALLGGGSLGTAGYPRTDSTLTVIMLSDEGDHYACYTGGRRVSGSPPCTGGTAFDFTDNVFLTNDVAVYSIIGLNASGQPGTCSSGVSGGPSAGSSNNADPSYYNLAAATGGSSSSICNTDYSPVLEAIAAQTAGKASEYVLQHAPVSSSISVSVDGASVPRNATDGFSYDAAGNSIVFAGGSLPAPGAAIAVSYTRFQ